MKFQDIYEDIEMRSIDLNSLFDELNKELFDNKLPKVPVIYSRTKQKGGTAVATRLPDGTLIPKKITMSSFSKRKDMNEIKGILAHEMIHIFEYHNQIFENHGKLFFDKLKELNDKTTFIIPRFDSTASHEISDTVKKKTFDVILIIKSNGEIIISVCAEGLIEKYLYAFEDRYDYQVTFNNWSVSFLKSDNKKLLKYPVSRKYSTVGFYKIDKELVEELLKDSTLIKKVEPNTKYAQHTK